MQGGSGGAGVCRRGYLGGLRGGRWPPESVVVGKGSVWGDGGGF